jgi:hypothetical protein
MLRGIDAGKLTSLQSMFECSAEKALNPRKRGVRQREVVFGPRSGSNAVEPALRETYPT